MTEVEAMIERAIRKVSSVGASPPNESTDPATLGYIRPSAKNSESISRLRSDEMSSDQIILAKLDKWRATKALNGLNKLLNDLRNHYINTLASLDKPGDAGDPPEEKFQIAYRLIVEFFTDQRTLRRTK